RKIKPPEIHIAGRARLPATAGEATRKIARARLPAAASVGVRRSGIDVVGIKAKLIVNLPFFRIAEDVVRLGEGLELFFRRFVAGINVRMILARKFAESLPNVVGRGRLLYSKNAVIIFLCRSGHDLAMGCLENACRDPLTSHRATRP